MKGRNPRDGLGQGHHVFCRDECNARRRMIRVTDQTVAPYRRSLSPGLMTLARRAPPGEREARRQESACGAGRRSTTTAQTEGCPPSLAAIHWGRYGASRRAVTLTRLVRHHGSKERRSGAFLSRSTRGNEACAGNEAQARAASRERTARRQWIHRWRAWPRCSNKSRRWTHCRSRRRRRPAGGGADARPELRL